MGVADNNGTASSSHRTTGAGTSVATASRQSIEERRHSSTAHDLTDYIYAEEPDGDVADDDDVFEMEPSSGGAERAGLLGNSTSSSAGSGAGGAERSSEAKRRTQSLGSLTGEPKSPRKVLSGLGRQTGGLYSVRTLRPLLFLPPFINCSLSPIFSVFIPLSSRQMPLPPLSLSFPRHHLTPFSQALDQYRSRSAPARQHSFQTCLENI